MSRNLPMMALTSQSVTNNKSYDTLEGSVVLYNNAHATPRESVDLFNDQRNPFTFYKNTQVHLSHESL